MLKSSVAAFRSIAIAVGLAAGISAAAQSPSLSMLDRLEPGQWQLRFRDGSPAQQICVRTGRELIQLRHQNSKCSRYVIEDGRDEVTIQYTCRGANYGRTSIRRETGSLAQVEKQALRVSELARDIAQTAETGLASGQPYGLAMLETDLASIQIHLRRLNAALAELEKKVVAE